jgi:serine/threonine protein kinase
MVNESHVVTVLSPSEDAGGPQAPRMFRPPQHGEVIDNAGRRYFLGRNIGEGYFGAAFECWDEWGSELVAKVFLPRNRTYEEVRAGWLTELQNLIQLRHPNITYMYDAFEYQDTFYLIIERCASTLYDLFQKPDYKGEQLLPYVARDVLQAVEYMHAAGYVHKDIHPGNVFTTVMRDKMDTERTSVAVFKMGDLGLSRLETDVNIFNELIAQWMLPPEFINPQEFGTIGRGVDIYQSGLLLLSILMGCIPQFTHDEIANGKPSQIALSLQSRYSGPIGRALRRHVEYRTPSAIEFWRDLGRAYWGT